MSNLYEIEFIKSNEYKNLIHQHQIGMNANVYSYLMMYDTRFYTDNKETFEEYINKRNPLIYFEGIEYKDGYIENPNELLTYNEYIRDIYHHTVLLERYTPRLDHYECVIPLTKNKYTLNGKFSTNVIAIFGKNYYTDSRIEEELKCLGYIHFKRDNIPLYNTKDYGMQINVSFDIGMNFKGGVIENNRLESTTPIRKYYNINDEIGINIMNNIILE